MDANRSPENRLHLWEVEQARLTLFVTDRPENFRDLWEITFGSGPLNESMDRSGPFPIYRAQGPFNDRHLSLQVEPNRIEWVLSDTPVVQNPPPYYAAGSFPEVLPEFAMFASEFIRANRSVVTRIAVGLILVRHVPSKNDGYEFLDGFLPFDLDINSREFYYRINRPRRSATLPHLEINRISDWMVMDLINAGFVSTAGIMQMASQTHLYLARLSLDVNSTGDNAEPIAPENGVRMFEELLALSEEIASTGDIA